MSNFALKNDDFRKLLTTPTVVRTVDSSVRNSNQTSHSFTHRQNNTLSSKHHSRGKFKSAKENKKDEEDIFTESQSQLNEILSKYRDRAAERRKGLLPSDEAEKARVTAAYKAVPANAATSLAERRRLEIQESKYLGGDMEHTHLVKGLDYSLLNKVRGEMDVNDKRDELEEVYGKGKKNCRVETISNNKLAKNICRLILQNELPKRNEMFVKNRMAYVIELEDEESDVPCTLLRSVVECPADQENKNVNADNLLISKLTQVLGYLRADAKKRKKTDTALKDDLYANKPKIYDDVDEYVPSRTKNSSTYTERKEKGSYFENNNKTSNEERRYDKDRDYYDQRDKDRRNDNTRDRIDKTIDRKDDQKRPLVSTVKEEKKMKRRRLEDEDNDAYAELYPSGINFLDAGGDSDEEADFSKMDMGNRKGPIKRWDFDTEKEYETYQESREAMPKAAYQYGVKMNGGRKTRKNTSQAGEKKLDRELDKINKILEDRKKFSYSNFKKPTY